MWNLDISGTSEVWVTNGKERTFVGRFKYANPKRSAKHFCKFLVANFTPEEYFKLKKTMPPIKVLETKGYVSFNVELAKKKGWI